MIYSGHSSITTQTRNQKHLRPRGACGIRSECPGSSLEECVPAGAGPSLHRGHLPRSAPDDRTTLLRTGSSWSTFFFLSCLKQLNWSKKKCNIHVLHWSSPDWQFLFLCQRKLEQFAGKYINIKIAYIFKPLFYLVSYWTKVKCDLQLGGWLLDESSPGVFKTINCLWREGKEVSPESWYLKERYWAVFAASGSSYGRGTHVVLTLWSLKGTPWAENLVVTSMNALKAL